MVKELSLYVFFFGLHPWKEGGIFVRHAKSLEWEFQWLEFVMPMQRTGVGKRGSPIRYP